MGLPPLFGTAPPELGAWPPLELETDLPPLDGADPPTPVTEPPLPGRSAPENNDSPLVLPQATAIPLKKKAIRSLDSPSTAFSVAQFRRSVS
jgi:hypothetical protein